MFFWLIFFGHVWIFISLVFSLGLFGIFDCRLVISVQRVMLWYAIKLCLGRDADYPFLTEL